MARDVPGSSGDPMPGEPEQAGDLATRDRNTAEETQVLVREPVSESAQTRIIVRFDAIEPVPESAETRIIVRTDAIEPASESAETTIIRADVTEPVPENLETRIIRTDAPVKTPVFVDPSGRRRVRVRRIAYGIGLVVLLIVSAVWVSQLNGWARPPAPANSSVSK